MHQAGQQYGPDQPTKTVSDGSRAWVLTRDSLIAPSGSGERAVSALRGIPAIVAALGGQAWVITSGDDRIWRASGDTGRIVQTATLPGNPVAVVVDDSGTWVALTDPASVVLVDSENVAFAAPLAIGGAPVDLGLDEGRITAAVRPVQPTSATFTE